MKDYNLNEPHIFDDQLRNFFNKVDLMVEPYLVVEIGQDDEDILLRELPRYKKTNYTIVLTQCDASENVKFCIQTMISVKDTLSYDKSIVDICSKVVSSRDEYSKSYVDNLWNEMIRCLDEKGKRLLVFASDGNYLSLIPHDDITRLINISIHQRDNIKLMFLVREGFNTNRPGRFFRNLRQSDYNDYIKEPTYMIPTIHISHHWGKTDSLTSDIMSQFEKEGIDYSIDKKDVTCGDDIRQYEEELGDSDAILAIIDEHYLKSLACMFELAKVFEKGEAKARLIVVLDYDERHFRETDTMVELQQYWNNEFNVISDKIQSLDGASAGIETRKTDDISLVLRMLPSIWKYWPDIIYAHADELKTPEGLQRFSDALKKKFIQQEANINGENKKRCSNETNTNFAQIGNNNKIINIGTVNGDVNID